MARLSVVFLSFAIFQLTWGLDVYHSKSDSLSPGILPSPVASSNIYRSSHDSLHPEVSSYPSEDSMKEWLDSSSFAQILITELIESGKVNPFEFWLEAAKEEKAEGNEENVKIDLQDHEELIDEDMHEQDRFFSL